jgi:ABC-type Fe3+/spermidine/putrescine transport system ATPase subunit
MHRPMLRLSHVAKSFGASQALEDASLSVEPGEFLALLGPSGSGKTTALRVIAGFERPDAGSVELDGEVVAGERWVAPEARRIGMVFQDYALFPHLDVARNIGFGIRSAGRAARVAELLDLIGLPGAGDRYPHELSGGEQQRVALARALAPEPRLVLLDEPWSSVDPLRRASLREDVVRILRAAGATAVVVTHDREEAFTIGDRIAVMRAGRVVQVGKPEELYFTPADRWCAEFVGASNVLDGRAAEGRVETALGTFAAGEGAGDVGVLVRPELVALAADGAGDAEVVERTFLGHDILYRIRLADGTTVCSQRPSNEDVPVGARVRVRVHDGRVALLSG